MRAQGVEVSPRQQWTIHPLVRYIALRVLIGIALIFGVIVVTFILTRLIPSDPVQAALGDRASGNPEIVENLRAQMGLNEPVTTQFVLYLGDLAAGNLGISAQTRTPVADDLAMAFPATVELAIVSVIFSTIIGVGLGLWAAFRRGRFADHGIRVLSLVGVSVPTFWLALIAFYLFSYQLALLPGSGRLSPITLPPPTVTGLYTFDAVLSGQWSTFADALSHLILPASVLSLFTIGLVTRFSRSAILEVLNMDYVRAARAKGLQPSAVVFRYVLRGALVPIITIMGVAFGGLLSGTVLVESIFSWQGIGQYSFNAAVKLDLPAVMGAGLIIGVVFVTVNLIVDLTYGFIDPRVRHR